MLAPEPPVPPLEPFKAATIIPTGLPNLPLLPDNARRFLAVCSQSGSWTRPEAALHYSSLTPCQCKVVREEKQVGYPILSNGIHVASKPMAAVLPTTGATSASLNGSISAISLTPPPSPSSSAHAVTASSSFGTQHSAELGVQTDDVGLDLDLLFHIEDMIRAQRSLTLPKTISLPSMFRREECISSCQDEQIAELQEALGLQSKVNEDLKRLLVGALSGNANLADHLIDLTSSNANLADRSADLAAQHAALAEVADTAGIAADVWRAKCLAGRVIASEAARRTNLAERQAQLARHALAHLLGERARLRLELGQVAAQLGVMLHRQGQKTGQPSAGTNSPPIVGDTIGLAALCRHLAQELSSCDVEQIQPVLCHTDSPGEHLALRVLTNDFPDDVLTCRADWRPHVINCNQSKGFVSSSNSVAPLLPLPQVPASDDLIAKALDVFSATRALDTQAVCFAACRGCKGEVETV